MMGALFMDGEDVLLRSPIVGDWMLEGAAMTQLEAALRLAFDDEGARSTSSSSSFRSSSSCLHTPHDCAQLLLGYSAKVSFARCDGAVMLNKRRRKIQRRLQSPVLVPAR